MMNLSRRDLLVGGSSVAVAPAISLPVIEKASPYAFNIEKFTVNAQSRRLAAEYTLDIQEPLSIYIGNRKWDGSIDHGIKLIDDILREEEAETTRIKTEDGTVLWEK